MFKKKAKTKPQALKKRTGSTDADADADEETVSEEAAAARAVKRRRHILTGLQYKRGVDAAQLASVSVAQAQAQAAVAVAASQKPASSSFAAMADDAADDKNKKLPSNTKMTNESQVWKERHQKAMEDFIQSKIQEQQVVHDADKNLDECAISLSSTNTTTTSTMQMITSKDQLFLQLAETAKQLSGKNDQESVIDQQRQHQEVLRSGAATAMAEVILPSSSSSSLFAASTSTTTTARRRPIGTTMRRGGGGGHAKEGTTAAAATAAAGGRVGFAAARGIQETKPREQSADEKAYKNFIQRQRR